MKIQWELYFLRQEKELQKAKRKKRKKQKIAICTVVCMLTLIILAGGISLYSFYNSDYGKLKRRIDQYDYRLASVKMAQYVNEKYGENVCNSDELSVNLWDPSDTRTYIGLRGVSQQDPGKQIYMIYLSKEEVVYLDTFQWDEISQELEREAIQKTGLKDVCCDTLVYSQITLRKRYHFCPWVATGAYITKYEGDLEQFFAQEKKVREGLPDTEQLEGLRINGGIAFYFGDTSIPTMRERIQNPSLEYKKQFESGLKEMEEKYQIDIASAVLFQNAFLKMKTVVEEKGSYSVFPTTFQDYGKGKTFFNPAYTLLSMSYDQIFAPKAEKAREGIYMFSINERERLNTYTCKETKPPADLNKFAEKELPDWQMDQTFLFQMQDKDEEEDYSVSYALAIDVEELYSKKEVSVIGWDTTWEVYQLEEESPYPPRLNDYARYRMEDGFMIFTDRETYGENHKNKLYSILIK